MFRCTVSQSKDKKGTKGMSRTELSKLIDLVEAGKILGMAPKTLRTWIHLRKISYVQIGREYRIKEQTIQEIITRGTVPAREPRN
jgi:excisionase family DNA binding protein